MVTRKYTPDYRLENEVNPQSGRIRTVPVYRGPLFSFVCGTETVARMRKTYPALTALAILVYGALLFTNTAAGRTMYVMLPFAPLCFPLLYAAMGCFRLLTAKEQVTREHKDKTGDRLSGASAVMMGFSGVSLVGHIVFWCLHGETWQDFLLLLGTAVIFGCGLAMFLLRKNLRMEQTGTTAKE